MGADSAFALDDSDFAPFFAANSQLPSRWREYFQQHDVIVSYLHDPEGIFGRNVRACGVRRFIAGPYRFEENRHVTEQLARPLIELGIAINDFAPRIEPSAIERDAAQFVSRVVACHPGSGSARKNWPIENWIALIDDLCADTTVIVVGGEADERELSAIRNRFADRVCYAVNWPLDKLAALLSETQFVGHDSGISHLAAAAGAPCLLLFGTTDPKVWAPRNDNVRILMASEKDLQRLAVAEVRDALRSF